MNIRKNYSMCLIAVAAIIGLMFGRSGLAADSFPFQDPGQPPDQRVLDLLKRMTIDEKITAMGTNPSVPRLGVVGARHVEGLHGLAQGGPGGWGRPRVVPTTIFPQAIGLGMT